MPGEGGEAGEPDRAGEGVSPGEGRVAAEAVEAVFREERGLLLASLVRRFGDLDLAEEVTSEAIEAALRHWPAEGVPARPGAWLLTTARRRAVDRLRRDQAYAARLAVLAADAERAEPAPPRTCPAQVRASVPVPASAPMNFRTSGSSCSSPAPTPPSPPRTAPL